MPLKEVVPGATEGHHNNQASVPSGALQALPTASDPAPEGNVPAWLGDMDLVQDEVAVGLTAELLETTSVRALDLPLAGTPAGNALAAPEVSHVDGSAGDADPEPFPAEASASASELADLYKSAAEVADQSLPETTLPVSLHDEQPLRAEMLRSRTVGHTPRSAPLTITQTALQMNMTAWAYVRSESEAGLAYLQALSQARTPIQVIDLQTREMTRALEAAVRFGDAFAAPTRQLLTGSELQPKSAA
ncbi:hypothetical protein [Methylobacterium dankookense]|uniref:hypothetical protein n=1 Tax=Methylobacterium dankookense TaxID=560405 RepID=UPI00119F8971|nr:hypothetical protein [Methylobacterium dankookense]